MAFSGLLCSQLLSQTFPFFLQPPAVALGNGPGVRVLTLPLSEIRLSEETSESPFSLSIKGR